MPTLISEIDVRLERSDLDRRIVLPRALGPDGYIVPPARTHGLHLSGLLKYIAVKSRITRYLDEIAEEEFPLRWLMGHAWEEYAASLYPDMCWQPGEAYDPVIMTCDGLSDACIEEFKFNRSKKYKGSDLLAKKWLWRNQGLGECIGYGADTVRWHVLSAFEFPDPIYTQYVYRFDEKEIEDCRRMLESNISGR